jgi:hypothetical protein
LLRVALTNAIEKSCKEAREDLFFCVLQRSVKVPDPVPVQRSVKVPAIDLLTGQYPFVRHRLFPSKEFDPQVV